MIVIHVDDDILVVDKPHGQHSQGTARGDAGSVISEAQKAFGRSVRLVHRLDRDASGLLVLARTPEVAGKLGAAFKGHEVQRTYRAAIQIPLPVGTEGTVDAPLKWAGGKTWVDPTGASARTHYRVVERAGRLTWLEVRLETGRMHQIRVHMAHALAPLVGDRKYKGPRGDHLHLRAIRLALTHPRTGEVLSFAVEMPA